MEARPSRTGINRRTALRVGVLGGGSSLLTAACGQETTPGMTDRPAYKKEGPSGREETNNQRTKLVLQPLLEMFAGADLNISDLTLGDGAIAVQRTVAPDRLMESFRFSIDNSLLNKGLTVTAVWAEPIPANDQAFGTNISLSLTPIKTGMLTIPEEVIISSGFKREALSVQPPALSDQPLTSDQMQQVLDLNLFKIKPSSVPGFFEEVSTETGEKVAKVYSSAEFTTPKPNSLREVGIDALSAGVGVALGSFLYKKLLRREARNLLLPARGSLPTRRFETVSTYDDYSGEYINEQVEVEPETWEIENMNQQREYDDRRRYLASLSYSDRTAEATDDELDDIIETEIRQSGLNDSVSRWNFMASSATLIGGLVSLPLFVRWFRQEMGLATLIVDSNGNFDYHLKLSGKRPAMLTHPIPTVIPTSIPTIAAPAAVKPTETPVPRATIYRACDNEKLPLGEKVLVSQMFKSIIRAETSEPVCTNETLNPQQVLMERNFNLAGPELDVVGPDTEGRKRRDNFGIRVFYDATGKPTRLSIRPQYVVDQHAGFVANETTTKEELLAQLSPDLIIPVDTIWQIMTKSIESSARTGSTVTSKTIEGNSKQAKLSIQASGPRLWIVDKQF